MVEHVGGNVQVVVGFKNLDDARLLRPVDERRRPDMPEPVLGSVAVERDLMPMRVSGNPEDHFRELLQERNDFRFECRRLRPVMSMSVDECFRRMV